jgi:hypothetical protein
MPIGRAGGVPPHPLEKAGTFGDGAAGVVADCKARTVEGCSVQSRRFWKEQAAAGLGAVVNPFGSWVPGGGSREIGVSA